MERIKNSSSTLLRYAIGAVILIWLFKTQQLNLDSLLLIDRKTICWVIGICVVQFFLCAYRVKLLLEAHQIIVSFKRCLIYNAIGIYYSMILPGGMSGDAVRAYYFWRCSDKKGNTSRAAMLGSLITDRLLGTAVLLLLGLVAATFSYKRIGISFAYLAAVWGCFIFFLCLYAILCGTHRYEWRFVEGSRFSSFRQRIQRLLATLDLSSYPVGIVLSSIVISVAVHMLTIFAIFIFANRLQSGLSFEQVMAIAPVGLVVNAIPISPGGIGVGEKSFELLFSLIGGQNGGNTFMLSRIFLFAPAIFGALFSLIFRHGSKKQSLANNYSAIEA